MSDNKPAFPDCAFPNSCECAARGYELEYDNCMWPAVRAAARAIGVDPMKLVEPKPELKPLGAQAPRPKPTALPPVGSVMLLGRTEDLAADLLRAIKMAGGEPFTQFSDEDARRLIFQEKVSVGLKSEAGYMAQFALWLCGRRVVFANGKAANMALMFINTRAGDAVYWSVYTQADPAVLALGYATFEEVEMLIAMLAVVGGGISKFEGWGRAEVPDDEQMAALRRM